MSGAEIKDKNYAANYFQLCFKIGYIRNWGLQREFLVQAKKTVTIFGN